MAQLLLLRMLQVAIMTDGLFGLVSFFNGFKTLAKPDQRSRFIWCAVFIWLTGLMIIAGSEIQKVEGVVLNVTYDQFNRYAGFAYLLLFLSILGIWLIRKYFPR